MVEACPKNILYQTAKFYRPTVGDAFIERAGLTERLQRNHRPLMLVVAPPGYGKTTLASHYAATIAENVTWISLSEKENDLRGFLYTLAHAWRSLYPGISDRLLKFADAQDVPAPEFIASAIRTDLENESPFSVLVLDDYHTIRESIVHDLVDSLLAQLLNHLKVFILSRSSPPLRLGRLRSQDKVADVRQRDLQFTLEETQKFVGLKLRAEPIDETARRIQKLTEGWPAGLQLILLAAERRTDIDNFVKNINGSIWQIETYLIEELLVGLDEATRGTLLRLALLDRFCAELINSLFSFAGLENTSSGTFIMETMQNRGMFLVPLDTNRKWFRFHHLFQELLLRNAIENLPSEEIRSTQKRAAVWMQENGEVESAIRLCVEAGEKDLAADIVNTHGTRANNRQDTLYAIQLLSILPQEIIDEHAGLLIMQGYCSIWASRYTTLLSSLRALEQLAGEDGSGLEPTGPDYARFLLLRQNLHFLGAEFQKIIEEDVDIPIEFSIERAGSIMLKAVSQQLVGDSNRARAELHSALEESETGEFAHRSRIMIGLCFFHWYAGEMLNLKTIATKLLNEGKSNSNDFAVIYALWFKAAAEYFLNDLDGARETLRPVEQRSWWPHQYSYVNCMRIAAAVHRAMGDTDRAENIVRSLVSHQVERNTTTWLPETLAAQADVALSSGRYADAYQWALDYELVSVQMPHGFAAPSMTAARILLRHGSTEAVRKAGEILEANESYFANINSNRFSLELLILRALYLSKTGNTDAAVARMTDAVVMARPYQNIRIFADIGAEISPLLNRVGLSDDHLRFIGEILSAIENDLNGHAVESVETSAKNLSVLSCSLEPLSKRETEVLGLLAEHLTNKEIGKKLFISPQTVKRHTHNIYGKLGVNGRKAAVAKASGFGII